MAALLKTSAIASYLLHFIFGILAGGFSLPWYAVISISINGNSVHAALAKCLALIGFGLHIWISAELGAKVFGRSASSQTRFTKNFFILALLLPLPLLIFNIVYRVRFPLDRYNTDTSPIALVSIYIPFWITVLLVSAWIRNKNKSEQAAT